VLALIFDELVYGLPEIGRGDCVELTGDMQNGLATSVFSAIRHPTHDDSIVVPNRAEQRSRQNALRFPPAMAAAPDSERAAAFRVTGRRDPVAQ
jgi:hypothetical protein